MPPTEYWAWPIQPSTGEPSKERNLHRMREATQKWITSLSSHATLCSNSRLPGANPVARQPHRRAWTSETAISQIIPISHCSLVHLRRLSLPPSPQPQPLSSSRRPPPISMVVPPPRAMPTELEAVSLHRLSDNLERLLDPIFLDCVETLRSSWGGGGVVGVHR
jgi:hypothetical protein